MKVPYFDIRAHYNGISKDLEKAFKTVLSGQRIILGPHLRQFEAQYADFSGTKYCVGVGSGLDAITLSLDAVGITRGDEVIVPSNAYIAALDAVSRLGATPVFVEPKEATYNIDPDLIEQAITKKTKAIIPVHFFGQACEMDPILSVSKKYKLNIVEDNAQSHGSTYKGKKTGSFGKANATSFYPTKNIGALGEAGAVTTNSKMIFNKISMLRNYGEKSKYENELIGYNSRLDELQAAFLLVKLKNIKQWTKKRVKIARLYSEGLKNIGDIKLPVTEKDVTNVFHIYPIRTKYRDSLQKYLFNKDIITSVHYPKPPYLQKAYSHLGYKKGSYPIAENLSSTSLSLPIYPEMKDVQVEYVIKSLIKFFFKQ